MIESIMTFFALWGIGFWMLVAIASIIFIVGCEKDTIGLSVFATIVLTVLYWKSLVVITTNPILITIIIVGWLVAGVLNSCWRLKLYAKKVVDEYNKNPNICSSPKRILKLSNNKSRITNWIIYWPWSLFWNLAGDFFTSLYTTMSGIYQRIIDNALMNVVTQQKDNVEEDDWNRKR